MAYDDLKRAIMALAEAAYTDDSAHAGLRAALGDVGDGPDDFNTVVVASVGGEDISSMVGAAWGPPLEFSTPESGPDPVKLNKSVIATLVQGLAILGRRQIQVDVGGSPITTGLKLILPPMLAQTRLLGWSIIGNATGSVVIDVWARNNAIPNNSHSIVGSGTGPNLTTDRFQSSSDLSDWDGTVLNVGDLVAINVDSVTGLDSFTLVFDVEAAFVP